MSRKGVEGLPLKYIIIVIIAVLVIDLILEMTGVIQHGVINALYNITSLLPNGTAP